MARKDQNRNLELTNGSRGEVFTGKADFRKKVASKSS